VKTSRSHSLNENAIDLDKSSGNQVSRQAIDKQLNSFTEKILKKYLLKCWKFNGERAFQNQGKGAFHSNPVNG